ncbi:MAG: dUTP diphosphatase [Oscillospiraceae bacterium]|nr:dUTP diphosphatase [Oscillospiraceae bacterium]
MLHEIKIRLLPGAGRELLPSYQSEGSAGMDLHARLDSPVVLEPHKPVLIPTGIAVSLPSDGYAAFVYARSGLATRHGIGLCNGVGVVDSDYRGEIKVGLINQTDIPYTVSPGDRIAQLVVSPVCRMSITETDELDPTARGEGGFGSTGR